MYEKHFTRKDVISMGADLTPCCVSRVWNRTWHKYYNSSFCPLHGEGVGGSTQNPSHCFLPVSAGPFLPPPGLQTAHRQVQRRSIFFFIPKGFSPFCRLCSWPSASLCPLLERFQTSPCAGGRIIFYQVVMFWTTQIYKIVMGLL